MMQIADLHFLAVEDHEFQRGVWLRILARLGATKVSVAADGREALLVMARDASVDIIISDLDMPGMDGAEFMRHLGERGLGVSVILASALDALLLASVETMAHEYGVRILGLIQKPITPAKLEALIRRHEPARPHAAPSGGAAPAARASFALDDVMKGLKKTRDQWLRMVQPATAVDPSVLAAISGGDAAAEREMLKDFWRVNEGDAAMLRLAVDKHDIAQVTIAAERIMGASRTVGAMALAAVCERLERAGGKGDWKEIQTQMPAFQRELERVNAHCEREK
jgi:CheY-like chemotaxis protein/HPt (histidine-containing phosphotransfer) domain-containing protein